jgi:Uma2 family endonuclease
MAANPVLSPFYSLEEYFALELASDKPHEYWFGQILCMAGGSDAHARISSRLHGECYGQLKGTNCEARTENAAVRNPLIRPRNDWPPFLYPDASIVCGPAVIESIRGIDVLTNPTVIFEVLSPSTEARDTGDKYTIYTSIPTLNHYVIVASETVQVLHWKRDAERGWIESEWNSLDDELSLESPRLTISLRDLYAGIFA